MSGCNFTETCPRCGRDLNIVSRIYIRTKQSQPLGACPSNNCTAFNGMV